MPQPREGAAEMITEPKGTPLLLAKRLFWRTQKLPHFQLQRERTKHAPHAAIKNQQCPSTFLPNAPRTDPDPESIPIPSRQQSSRTHTEKEMRGSMHSSSYVVYLGCHSHGREGAALASNQERAKNSHYQFLGSVLGSEEKAQDAIFYSYTRYINGFAATLEEEDAMQISKHPSVISVFPNRGHKLHTTRSWEFLGMEKDGRVRPNSIWAKARYGDGVIIGNLDTGVWPEAGSFSDDGMGPVPARWRGVCHDQSSDDDAQVRCNRKLIGAQYFNKGYAATVGRAGAGASPASTRDSDGHGTHTLSTAAGRFVPGANLFGYGNGTAKGGAPGARVAAYKVCWRPFNGSECFDADIIAAFDAAIHDGVDVLSVSLGGAPTEYFRDGVAIGSFHAVRNGVTVVSSAGNSGPGAGTVSNTAPWLVTVGASTMDREFPAYLVLGNKKQIKGQSLSPVPLPANEHYRLISSVEAKAEDATVVQASASGYITLPNTALETKPAPFMAAFSSQGPNAVTPQILKPDITAPGVSILAAFTGLAGPTGLTFDSRRVLFNSESGTSMSCPHVAGIAGLLKALHPDWSPAAIKSAIMTTARVQDNTRKPMSNSSFLRATPFAYGAGHVQPNRAADPGLVYDTNAADYLHFLCALGYNSTVIDTFMDGPHACPTRPRKPEDLNYPSVTVPHLSASGEPHTVTRRVRNVGPAPGRRTTCRVHDPRRVSVFRAA
uniref:Subtilisin-like protease n=1 Tax=Triticum aestivum TaxID=4565 RepID=Q2L3V3_WHEAT|nr:subtilisin-like protease [Triticum aestivum]